MKRCAITYEVISSGAYSQNGLNTLSRRLRDLKGLPFTSSDLRREASARAGKMSIQGVQPKISAVLSVARQQFELVSTGGKYILKPKIDEYPNVPENEDVSMKMAKAVGIEVPAHGMIYASDGSLCYFIKRFDREPKGHKLHVEDFAQLLGRNRDTKYNASLEQVIAGVNQFCTFPKIELLKLFKRVVFSFLIGNEDAHLKNYSIIRRADLVELSPAYDLLNTSIVIQNPVEESALPLAGKKSNLKRDHFVDYLAAERMNLPEPAVMRTLDDLNSAMSDLWRLLDASFLPTDKKEAFKAILLERATRLGLAN